MRILTALSQMQTALASVHAPARQQRGVAEWRQDVAAAVAAARQFRNPAGLELREQPGPALTRRLLPSTTRFVEGDVTHAAWLDLCRAVLAALGLQQDTAAAIIARARQDAEAAKKLFTIDPDPRHQRRAEAALATVRLADAWLSAAVTAICTGQALMLRENTLGQPIGAAIARAGGLRNVTRNRNYHQAGAWL